MNTMSFFLWLLPVIFMIDPPGRAGCPAYL